MNELQPGGGLLATVVIMFVSYVAGTAADVADALGWLTRHLTPGWATLIVGLLSIAANKAPAAVRWLATWWRKGRAD